MWALSAFWSIFWRFLYLGCISFGGPSAHIGYFQHTFVRRLAWLSADEYGKLVALSQFLPGPGSSQIGFAIGLRRAGLIGGIAAFIGFTLPSFVLMVLLAILVLSSQTPQILVLVTHGLKLVAVVVVTEAVVTMFRQYCQRTSTRLLAILTALMLTFLSAFWLQISLISIAAGIGLLWPQQFCASSHYLTENMKRQSLNRIALVLFVVLFAMSIVWLCPLHSLHNNLLTLAAQFYQSGSLVFGGGHVVLPLLQHNVEGSLSNDQFLLGYAAAQGVPGPMFSFAAFLGAQLTPNAPLLGAIIATLALFLPGLLLVYACYQGWTEFANRPRIAGLTAAINATVVGILFSALIDPVAINAIFNISDLMSVIVGFILIRMFKTPIWLLISGMLLITMFTY
jgi:chromate transporter